MQTGAPLCKRKQSLELTSAINSALPTSIHIIDSEISRLVSLVRSLSLGPIRASTFTDEAPCLEMPVESVETLDRDYGHDRE